MPAAIELLRQALRHWRLALAGMLLAALAVQTWRLHECQLARERAQLTTAAAISESVARGATSGVEALQNYVERQHQDAPVVERVVTRVRNVCLRDRSGGVPVPAGAGRPDDASARARDDEDRAFVAAIQHDLAYCNGELNRLRSVQQWIRDNGGAP